MSVYQLRKALLGLGLAALVAAPAPGRAQVRDVVYKEVSVGRSEATLRLEFADDDRLEIAFEDGEIRVDGDVVGRFEPGGELEAAWRELLGTAVSLDDGELAEMLYDWTVPADLAGDLADLAREIDRTLEDALADVDIRFDSDDGSISLNLGDGRGLVQALLGSVGRLGALEEALAGLGADVRVYYDEGVTVDEDEVVEGSLVVIDGDLRLDGQVEGDVVVVGGTLTLGEKAEVDGEVRVVETRVTDDGSRSIRVVDVAERERDAEEDLRSELRSEIRRELERELRNERHTVVRVDDDRGPALFAPFRAVGRAVGGVFEKLFAILVLALIGAGVLAFAGENVDVIAETARRSPGRSAMVGVAGTILLLPVWILGTIALAVSIIFIPVAIAWLPLFPLAAAFAALIGYLAVARNAGEWLADSNYPWTGWIRKSNSWVTMLGGLVGLMFAFILASVVSAAPFLGFFGGLLAVAGTLVTLAAIQVGFGAVLLTRAGRRREAWATAYDPDAAWEEAMTTDLGGTGRTPGEADAETDEEPNDA